MTLRRYQLLPDKNGETLPAGLRERARASLHR